MTLDPVDDPVKNATLCRFYLRTRLYATRLIWNITHGILRLFYNAHQHCRRVASCKLYYTAKIVTFFKPRTTKTLNPRNLQIDKFPPFDKS